MKTTLELLTEIRSYRPADRMFTSQEEMDMLVRHFDLEHKTLAELQDLRNNAVLWYSAIFEALCEVDKRDEAFGYMRAMMSVTAVIDHYKYNINPDSI